MPDSWLRKWNSWKNGKPELKDQYNLCKTQQDKKDFFYNVYLLDPEVSSKKIRKLDSDKQKEQVSTMEGWWTKEQMAQDKGILPHMDNYKALTDASVAGLQERPHEDEQLAKLGVMQYEYTFVEKKHTKEQELQLQEHVEDVATDDFNAMRLALGGGCKQKTITTKGASVAWWQLACNRQWAAGEAFEAVQAAIQKDQRCT